MNRLIKKLSKHDLDNRDYAIAIINGKVYTGDDHYDCIDDCINNSNLTYDDIDPDRTNVRYFQNLNFEKNISIAFGHIVENQKAIFLETNTIQNMSISEAISILKNTYNDYIIYDDDSNNVPGENDVTKYKILSK